MRLAECLNQSDIGNLRRIAERHALTCPMYSKNTLLQEILARFAEPDYMPARIQNVSDSVSAALLDIALDGRVAYAEEELLAILTRIATSAERSAVELLRELLQEGLIFETGTPSRRGYVCPTDIWKKIHSISTRPLREAVQSTSVTPTVYRSDGTAMARDALTVLQFVRNHEVRLTQDGVIFKRQQQQLLQLLEIREEPLSPHVGWRFGYGRRFHDYPDRFALIYDHLYAEGCIVETTDGALRIVDDRAAQYSARSEQERGHLLYRFWLRSYRSAIPGLRFIVAKLAEMTTQAWVYGESLHARFVPAMKAYFYDAPEQVLTTRILHMLVCLGVVARGQSESGSSLFMLSPLGEALIRGKSTDVTEDEGSEANTEHLAVIQPTFDILVPSDGDQTYGWDLQIIAELQESGPMRQYQITRESTYRALEQGWDEERMLTFLRGISAYPVPGNVEQTIRSWCHEYGRVRLEMLCVISCQDELVQQEILRLAPLLGTTMRTIGGCAIGVSTTEHDTVKTTLRKLGYLVQTK